MERYTTGAVGTGRRALLGALAVGTLLLGIPTPATGSPTPSVTIGDVTIAEGNAGTTNATFTIQASPPPKPPNPLQVGWSAAGGSAQAPADFTASSGVVTLSKTYPSRTVTVPIVGDVIDESNETFVVNLANLVGSPGRIGDAQAVGTITDDDAPPVLSVNDTSVTEGNAGTATATFTISLSAPSSQAVSVNWATTAGTATAGSDFVGANGSRTIAAGATTATVGITVNGDIVDEPNETFSIQLSAPTNATLGDATGLATITDDDPVPSLSIADASLTEGDAGTKTLSFVVSLSTASGRTVTVQWATADDGAIGGSDYVAASGTLTFVPGDTSGTVSVTVNGDGVAELDEAFVVTLGPATHASIADGLALGTIVDDEGLPVIDVSAPSVDEGDTPPSSLTFTISLSHPSALPVTVDWTTADGTAVAGTDYAAASGTVSFAPLDTSESVTIDVLADTTYERDETVALELADATNAPIGRARRLGTLANDDDPPTITIGDASATEGNAGSTMLPFTVSLSTVSDLDATVDFATNAGTAAAASDFISTTGTLTIPAGDTSATIEVPVTGDTRYEIDETFSVDLNGPVDASISGGTAQGTIRNDDPAKTSLTIKVTTGVSVVKARGLLEPTKRGHRVRVSLFRRTGGTYVKVAVRSVLVQRFRDRDGDGRTDGRYVASFTRPRAGGRFKIVVRFAGTPAYKASSIAKPFRLAAP